MDHGPQNHKAHLEKLLQYCEPEVKEEATLVYGGRQVQRSGFFMEPTVFTDVEDHMYLAKEESFEPIMVISKFQNGDIDGVLNRANNSECGLASGVFMRNINKAMYVSNKLEAGRVFINTYNKMDVAAPFGRVKQSGFGKDLGEEALNEYLKTKMVTLQSNASIRKALVNSLLLSPSQADERGTICEPQKYTQEPRRGLGHLCEHLPEGLSKF
ncbi:hypothetical protein NN561_018758 [Cricetulus griseus]